MFDQWHKEVSLKLETYLEKYLPNHEFAQVIKYSSLPAGKLFRPMLVLAMAKDLGEIHEDHYQLASSIELHHTYTLIHDDLPSMDDDDYRRGRLSSHKKFNEWKAILAGDALLCLSLELIADLNTPNIKEILKLYTSYTGSKGLIFGQVLDLGNEISSLEKIIKLHELKTGRLIQLSLQGSAIISQSSSALQKDLFDLGKALGVNFQLFDDLCELTETVNKHELEVNPFINYKKDILLTHIKENTSIIRSVCKTHNLNTVQSYIELYYQKIHKTLSSNVDMINQYLDIKEDEINSLI